MLRRTTVWLSRNRAIIWLWFCTGVSFLAWAGNTIWPAPEHGYLDELALLTVIGAAAIWLYPNAPNAAPVLYFSGALLPVGAMAEHFAPDSTPIVVTPLLGVFVVAALIRHPWGLAAYTAAGVAASLAIGELYQDVGGGVALAFFTALAGGAMAHRDLECIARAREVQAARADIARVGNGIASALSKTGQLERGLDKLLEEHMNGHKKAPG